ncbi:helix-turn-helix domain-containing protein [Mesorhizobium sp. B2-3-4]|uniref:helix-turn-helix domain-containing protein n=1 Tax=Mesorhizobium sp. B2-3-4 TaxID=2589959 RepID=UPI00112A1451|nr:helix-turn-helix domain-containing protein [Mesorhizobium sp. B2-3-4]TPM40537.1 helix-turn-helix domain-containing protein [Mesorhizobium sp. B2-3-4]
MLRSFEQLRDTARADLLIAADEEHAAVAGSGAYAMPWHWHDCLMFILPSQGAVEIKHEDRREGAWLSQDRFAVVPANRAHETRAAIGAHRHIALYVTGATLRRLDRQVGSLSEFHRRTRTTVLARCTATLRALQTLSLRNSRGGYGNAGIKHALTSALLVQCIAEIMAGEMVSGASHREHGMALVEDLKEYLTAHADEEIPLNALADRFGISRRHITRLFREGTGASVGEFQLRIRLQTARELLSGTDLPVGEIAFRVGFESGAALAHAMRRADGRSPSDIRKNLARSIKI